MTNLLQDAADLLALEERSAVRIRARTFVELEEIKAELGRESKLHSSVRLIRQLLDHYDRAPAIIRALRERNDAQARIIRAFDVESPTNALKQSQACLESLEAERDIWRERADDALWHVEEHFLNRVPGKWLDGKWRDLTPSEIAARVKERKERRE